MASSAGRANGGGGGKDGDGLRPWLMAFLQATYFERCSLHDSYRNHCNMFCTDCMGDPVCLHCVRIDHKGHTVIQVRKSSNHNAVRVGEMQEFIDISDIQTFITNKAEVVLLNKLPQTNPRKQVINTCKVCRKNLAPSFRFCSIGCKLGVTKRGDTNLLHKGDETKDSSSGIESVVSSTPGKVQKTRDSGGPRIGVTVPDQKAADCCNPHSTDAADATPSTKPVFNHSNSRKRKGTPRRALFL